jgi:hypothetical protein
MICRVFAISFRRFKAISWPYLQQPKRPQRNRLYSRKLSPVRSLETMGKHYFVKRLNIPEQTRQCAYNIILRRVRQTLLPWKNIKYYIFVCVCACAHVALLIQRATRKRHIVTSFWPLWIQHIFPHHLINGAIFEKNLLNIKCVF